MIKQFKYDLGLLMNRSVYLYLCMIVVLFSFAITVSSVISMDKIDLSQLTPYYRFNIILSDDGYKLSGIIMILPLICVIPISQLIISEKKSVQNILVRVKKKNYILSKLLVSFFSGFSVIFIFFGMSVLYSYIVVGNFDQNLYYSYGIISPESIHVMKGLLFSNLILSNPEIVLWFYIFLISLFSGFFAQISMCIGLFTYHRILIYGSVFMVCILTTFTYSFALPFFEVVVPYAYNSTELVPMMIIYACLCLGFIVTSLCLFLKRDVT